VFIWLTTRILMLEPSRIEMKVVTPIVLLLQGAEWY
jgi:hypothetical protein